LLEALACGCPVVSTTVGAEGLDAVDGVHMLLRDTPQEFADAVVTLLQNPALAATIGREGRAWVIQQHAWARSAALLRDAYDKLIGHEDPTPALTARQREQLAARVRDALDSSPENRPDKPSAQ